MDREIENYLSRVEPESSIYNHPVLRQIRLKRKRGDDPDSDTLYDVEWIELMLSYCLPRKDVIHLAQDLAVASDGLKNLLSMDEASLKKIHGINKKCRESLLPFLSLLRAYGNICPDSSSMPVLGSPGALRKYICDTFLPEDMYSERVLLYFLDAQYRLRYTIPLCDTIAWGEKREIQYLIELLTQNDFPNIAMLIITPGRNGRPDDYEWGHLDLLYNILMHMQVNLLDIAFVGNDVYSMFSAGELESYRKRVSQGEVAPVYPYFDFY